MLAFILKSELTKGCLNGKIYMMKRQGGTQINMEYVLICGVIAAFVIAVILIINRRKRKKDDVLSSEAINPVEETSVSENKETVQTEEKQNTAPLDAQIRFLVEHQIIPMKLNSDPIYITTSIIAEKGIYINGFYKNLYEQQKKECPYSDENFVVSKPYKIGGANAVKIDMPKENIAPKLCRRAYILYNESFTKVLWATEELCSDGSYRLYSYIDSEREDLGVADNSVGEKLNSVAEDEEIGQEKFSDVIDKLMKSAPVAQKTLLSEPEEIKKHSAIFMSALMQSQKLKQEGKCDEALKLIGRVILTEAPKYINTPDKMYHCFRNTYEVLLYANLYHPINPQTGEKKQLEAMQVDMSGAYLIFGAMMLEQKRYDEAIEIMLKAVEANPVNVQIMFALADAYKGNRYLKSYLATVKKAHVCAYQKADISRIYRYYAYYYTQIKEFELAASLAYASKYFDSDEKLFNQCIEEIRTVSGENFEEIPMERAREILIKNGIAWGAKELSISVIKLMNSQFAAANNEQGIKMCSQMLKEIQV